MPSLTQKQKQILNYIDKYTIKNNISPTIEEMRKKFHLSSPSTVSQHLNALENKGFIKRDKNCSRSIELVEKDPIIEVPIIGMIAAGNPIEALENCNGTIPVPRKMLGKFGEHYALIVKGDSMIEEGIFDGDIVVIKKQSVAENGQTVVAIIDDNEATLKKIYRENGIIKLQPRNQNMLPIYREEVEIRGIVMQIINQPSNIVENKSRKIKTIDLFAGVGGIRLGFETAGFETVFANDFEKACKNTYDLNFKKCKLTVEDIKKIGLKDIPDFDFLLAGFPCQSFSIAGHRKGFEDEERGDLFFEIVKIIKEKRPEGFLLENVKNLRGHDGGKTFKTIIDTLENIGYKTTHKVMNTIEYGNIPQNRERIYIIGFKNPECREKFNFPDKIELKKTINDMLENNPDEKYYYNGKPLYEKIKDSVTEKGKIYQWRRKYVRENKKGVCPTLTANMGMGGHNVPIIKDKKGIRKLTPLECFRLQGFPESYKLPNDLSDSALYKQAGNSVSVTVIKSIAKQIKKAMEF